jgi:hypothetical protein
MISSLLILHVILMMTSLILTPTLTALVAFGKHVSSKVVAANLILTSMGVVAGIFMLLSQPLDIRCAVLVSYLIAFSAAHAFIRRRSVTSIQTT